MRENKDQTRSPVRARNDSVKGTQVISARMDALQNQKGDKNSNAAFGG